MTSRRRETRTKFLMISAVAERYDIHPQTLRLYEREGLITPVRSKGNTRLYDQESLERLERVLFLTRELGVNLAGVEVILHLRHQLEEMQAQIDEALEMARREAENRANSVRPHHALVRVETRALVARKRR